MKYRNSSQTVLRLVLLGTAITMLHSAPLRAQSGFASRIGAPSVPAGLQVPAGNQVFLKAAATGTQNYLCLPSGWTFIGPQATLFVTLPWLNGPIQQQIATHFLTPNALEGGTARPAWQSSIDTSMVMAKPVASSTDPNYVDPAAVPWLLLQAAGAHAGPSGGSAFAQTTYLQRINTSGGVMPVGACTVGERAFVPYTADYVFYRKAGA